MQRLSVLYLWQVPCRDSSTGTPRDPRAHPQQGGGLDLPQAGQVTVGGTIPISRWSRMGLSLP